MADLLAPSLAALTLALALPAAPAWADSIHCDGGIVSTGDTRVDLLGKCGPPSFQERRAVERGNAAWDPAVGAGASVEVQAAVETWTYDFGPNRFLMTVTLRNGLVASVERGGYGRSQVQGRDRPGVPVARCDGRFREGDRKADLLGRCGAPTSREVWEEKRADVVRVGGTEQLVAGWATVVHELWIYNLGPNRLVQLVYLDDGQVVRVENGGRGYQD